MSAKRVSVVQLEVSEEAALVIKSLLYALNWSEFAFAESVATAIEDLELDDDGNNAINYNEDSGEFDRA